MKVFVAEASGAINEKQDEKAGKAGQTESDP
jgi:hypothetical protein